VSMARHMAAFGFSVAVSGLWWGELMFVTRQR
jgi:hypothetical protein